MQLGNIEVIPLYENQFRIDGGAMFGIIPKKIWQKIRPADEDNFIWLDMRPLLIKAEDQNIIVDAGIGDAIDDKTRKIYGITKPSELVPSLRNAGLEPEDIDSIIFTHLHADHALGGLTRDDSGNVVKVFPNAKYYAHRFEIEDALETNERTAATYLPELLKHYEEVQAIDNDGQLFDSVSVHRTGGHTRGHMAILVQSEDQSLVYPGDIIPTTAHIKAPYVGAVDMFPLESMQQKKAMIAECLKNNHYVAFDHDADITIGKFEQKDNDIVPVTVERA